MSSAEISYRRRWVGDREVMPTDWKFNGRPLVVIDPGDREQVERLADAFTAIEDPPVNTAGQHRVASMQAALRSLIAPPRPEEPTGLGAVVVDDEGHTHVLSRSPAQHPWVGADGKWREWRDIDAVRVLSEGVVA